MHFFYITGAPLYEDLEKALQILSAQYPLYIVNNNQCGYIELFLAKTGFAKYFRDISVMEIPVLIKVPTSARLLIRAVRRIRSMSVSNNGETSRHAAKPEFRLSLRNMMLRRVPSWICGSETNGSHYTVLLMKRRHKWFTLILTKRAWRFDFDFFHVFLL